MPALRTLLLLFCLFNFAIISLAQTVASYVPHRVYDTKKKRFTDFEAMTADLARANVIFFGEQHDDPGGMPRSRASRPR